MDKDHSLTVSVCVITYNHEHYIQQCLQAILAQKTNFNFEIVIGEDCSTDHTLARIEALVAPHKNIKLLDHHKNLGVLPNFIRTLKAAQGQYIAFCEGDDYWIDENKLQKQVDFLEANSQYGGVCGEVVNFDVEKSLKIKHPFKPEGAITFNDIITKNRIHSNTILFRKELLNIEALNSIRNLYIGDWFLHLLITKKKPYYYLPEYFALYREHDQGVFSKKSDFYKFFQKSKLLEVYLNNDADSTHTELVRESLAHQIFGAFKVSSKDNKEELKELFAILWQKKIIKINRSMIRGAYNVLK